MGAGRGKQRRSPTSATLEDGAQRTHDVDGGYRDEWVNDRNERHRVDGPALVRYDKDGNITIEEWYVNGLLHRDEAEGPAVIARATDGVLARDEYRKGGAYHREHGPALIIYFADGSVFREDYCIDGELHNESGPASIVEGDEEYYLEGRSVRKSDIPGAVGETAQPAEPRKTLF